MLAMLLVFGLGQIIFNAVYFIREDQKRAIERAENRCKRDGSRLARIIKTHLRGDREDAAVAELQRAIDEKDVIHVTVCGEDMRVLYDVDPSLVGKLLTDRSLAVAAARFKITEKALVKHVKISSNEQRVVGGFPFDFGKRVPRLAVLVIELDLVEALQEASKDAEAKAIGASAALAVALVLMWLMLHHLVTKRVTSILREATSLTLGEPAGQPLRGNDELAQIDHALRDAHARIAEQAANLRSREERYRLMVETLPEMVMVVREGKIEFMNSTGIEVVRASGLNDVVGRQATLFIPPNHAQLVSMESLEAPAKNNVSALREGQITRLDGSTLEVSVVASTFRDERGQALQIVVHDISERKAAEARREALAREIAEERLRLEHEIVKASEREQRRMGQDLHDDICQRLAAVKMNMQDLEEEIAEQSPALVDHADAIVDRLTDAIRITRGLARGLSPVNIEAGGLGAALLGLVRSSRDIFGIECELELDDNLPPFSDHPATQLYRIAQECVANAAKHGQARVVRVTLFQVNGDELVLRISNDGLPFIPPGSDASGMGLPIMRYRAESIGATLEIDPAPPDATVAVICRLPMSTPANFPLPNQRV